MSSFFHLELDTTPPDIRIFAPNYTTREIKNEIVLDSNEELSSFQEIYIVDSNGVQHEFEFLKKERRLIGEISFNNFSFGFATIYARVSDEVGNVSNLATNKVNIIPSLDANRLKLDISEIPLDAVSDKRTLDISNNTLVIDVVADRYSSNVSTSQKHCTITLDVE